MKRRKILTALLTLILVLCTPVLLVACGSKTPTRQDEQEEDPTTPVEEVDVPGCNVVLTLEEADALYAQAEQATFQPQSTDSVRAAGLTLEQITKTVAVKILNQIITNMQNATILGCYDTYERNEDGTFYTGGDYYVLNALGESYNCSYTIDHNQYLFRCWTKLEGEKWFEYACTKNGDDGEVVYTKRSTEPSYGTAPGVIQRFWPNKTILATKVLTTDDIGEITLANGKIYFNVSALLGENNGLAVQEQFIVKNGRIAKDYLHWEENGDRVDIATMEIDYQYDDEVDASLLTLPTLPDGVSWVVLD
ncbi:MAG: hypothetical protein NC133_01310 [Prevotella sp.]|nr:hypothetical protein [Prevotella sp.]